MGEKFGGRLRQGVCEVGMEAMPDCPLRQETVALWAQYAPWYCLPQQSAASGIQAEVSTMQL